MEPYYHAYILCPFEGRTLFSFVIVIVVMFIAGLGSRAYLLDWPPRELCVAGTINERVMPDF